ALQRFALPCSQSSPTHTLSLHDALPICLLGGELHRKRRSTAVTVDGNRPVVGIDDVFDDGQTKARRSGRARAGFIDSIKTFKNKIGRASCRERGRNWLEGGCLYSEVML